MPTGSAERPGRENGPLRFAMIVLVGAFNPLILQPRWLADHDVVSEYEANAVEESGQALVSPELTGIQCREFGLEVTRDRVQVAATDELETPLLLADLVINVFSLLSHTPVRAVGLNHVAHQPMEHTDLKAIFASVSPPARAEELLENVQLQSVRWSAERPDDRLGVLRLTIEPSEVLSVPGVFLSFNDHVELGEDGTGADVAQLVSDEWQPSLRRADELFANLTTRR